MLPKQFPEYSQPNLTFSDCDIELLELIDQLKTFHKKGFKLNEIKNAFDVALETARNNLITELTYCPSGLC